MILRKLASAIRRQDWFTVLLEFVIVVLGIFIGRLSFAVAGVSSSLVPRSVF